MPEVVFNGPAGRIEGLYTESANKSAPLALVLHHHPLHGGHMNYSVVYNIHNILAQHGYTVLRINFRGVGRSVGQFDNGIGEMTDAATALDWLQINNPLSTSKLIVGFSFGAWIAMQLVTRRPEISNFIAISLPVTQYDFGFLSPCPSSGLIIQGNQDSVVPEVSVLELADKLSKQKFIKIDYKMIPGADHFFRNKTDELSLTINEYLQSKSSNQHFIDSSMEDIEETTNVQHSKMLFLD